MKKTYSVVAIGCAFCPVTIFGPSANYADHDAPDEIADERAEDAAEQAKWRQIEGDVWACPRCSQFLPEDRRT